MKRGFRTPGAAVALNCSQGTQQANPLLTIIHRCVVLFQLTSHCPSVSNTWKPVSQTPGSVSMWTSTHWLGLSHSSFFILPTLPRRPRDSPPSPPPRTERMVLISRSVSRYGPTHLVRSPPHLLPHLCQGGERENIRHSLLRFHFLAKMSVYSDHQGSIQLSCRL